MIYYPIPIHKQEAYKSFSFEKLENSEKFQIKYFLCLCAQKRQMIRLNIYQIV